jgi:hypothetical protein
MFLIPTIRRGCRPAFSATKVLMTNESSPQPRVGLPPLGRMDDDDFDVLADGAVVGRITA